MSRYKNAPQPRVAGHSIGGREPLCCDPRGGVAWKLAIYEWSTGESNRACGKGHWLLPEVCNVVPSVRTHKVNHLAFAGNKLKGFIREELLAQLQCSAVELEG